MSEGPDPRSVLLHRASALLLLVNAGELSLDETVQRLIRAVNDYTGPCGCEREIYERICALAPKRRRQSVSS